MYLLNLLLYHAMAHTEHTPAATSCLSIFAGMN